MEAGQARITTIQAGAILTLISSMDTLDVVSDRYLKEAISMAQSMHLFDTYVSIPSRRRRNVYTITSWGLYGLQGYVRRTDLYRVLYAYPSTPTVLWPFITGAKRPKTCHHESPCLPTRTLLLFSAIYMSGTLGHRHPCRAITGRLPGRPPSSGWSWSKSPGDPLGHERKMLAKSA